MVRSETAISGDELFDRFDLETTILSLPSVLYDLME